MSVGQSKSIRARQGKMITAMKKSKRVVDELKDRNVPGWREIGTDHNDTRSMSEIARDLGLPFRNAVITVDGNPLDQIPTSFFMGKGRVETVEDQVITGTFTTNIVMDEIVDQKPISEELKESLVQWWAEKFQRDFERQMLGQPSEYEQSLRAAGAKV